MLIFRPATYYRFYRTNCSQSCHCTQHRDHRRNIRPQYLNTTSTRATASVLVLLNPSHNAFVSKTLSTKEACVSSLNQRSDRSLVAQGSGHASSVKWIKVESRICECCKCKMQDLISTTNYK